MERIAIAVVLGVILGAAGTYVGLRPSSDLPTQAAPRDVVVTRDMPAAEAERHRANGYVELTRIDDILALPGGFDRRAALYALAGRYDADRLQQLLFELDRIVSTHERHAALMIAFQRLTELDAPSALALARTASFAEVVEFERAVWAAWARSDYESALDYAADQSGAELRRAAQSLYVAFGYLGNETAADIERRLGVEPDYLVRSRYLESLADESMEKAIAYADALPPGPYQQEAVGWLAFYAVSRDPLSAPGYEKRFRRVPVQMFYRNAIAQMQARADPLGAVQRLLAKDGGANPTAFYQAMSALAAADTDTAIAVIDSIESTAVRQRAVYAVAGVMAAKDPDRALVWARERDALLPGNGNTQAFARVLQTIAYDDPQRAMDELLSIDNVQLRSNAIWAVVNPMTREQPAVAAAIISQIDSNSLREQAEQVLAQGWLQNDAEAAVEWMLGLDKSRSEQLLSSMSSFVVGRQEIDVALRILPRLSESTQVAWRQQLAMRMAVERSPEEALAFINRWEGETDYARLQAATISSVAQKDPVHAWQLAGQIADNEVRDSVYAAVVVQQAAQNPRTAVDRLAQISSEQQRLQAGVSVFSLWAGADADAAQRYALSMPAGVDRDNAIAHVSRTFRDPTREQQRIINSIDNDDQRHAAWMHVVTRVARLDSKRARELIRAADVNTDVTKQLEEMVRHIETSL